MSNVLLDKNSSKNIISAVDWVEPVQPGQLYVSELELYYLPDREKPYTWGAFAFSKRIIQVGEPFLVLQVLHHIHARVLWNERVVWTRIVRGHLVRYSDYVRRSAHDSST